MFTVSGAEVLHLLGRGHSSYLVLVATVGLLFWVPEACNRRKDSSWQATTSGHSSGCQLKQQPRLSVREAHLLGLER